MRENKLRLVACSGRVGLAKLYDDWLQLITHASNLCFSHYPQWYDAHLNRTSENIIFCSLYRESKLVAVFPLVVEKEKSYGLVTITIPYRKLFWMPDSIVAEDEDYSYLFHFLCKNIAKTTGIKWDLFMVHGTLETSHASQCLKGQSRFSTFITKTAGCNILRIRPYELMFDNYSGKLKKKLRKVRNKLIKMENVEFQKARNSEDLAWAFNEYVTLEVSGWKGNQGQIKGRDKGNAMALHETKRKFYEEIVKDFGDDELVEINLLKVGKKTIAAQITLIIVDTCFLLKIAYDEDYAKLSPGNMLLEYLLKSYQAHASIKNICLISNYKWMLDWGPEQLSYITYEYFNKTPKGLLACTILHTKKIIKGMIRKARTGND